MRTRTMAMRFMTRPFTVHWMVGDILLAKSPMNARQRTTSRLMSLAVRRLHHTFAQII
jgi:hypothetical protein